MSFWTKLLVPVLALAMAGVAGAAKGEAKGGKAAKQGAGLRGRIVSVSGDGSIIVKTGGKKNGGQNVTIQTNAQTAVVIDGVAGKTVKDLKAGGTIVVKPASGTAKEIKATTQAKGKGKAAGEAKQAKKAKRAAKKAAK